MLNALTRSLSMALLLCSIHAGAEVRELRWEAMIPEGAPPQPTQNLPLHDLADLAAVLEESGEMAAQQYPAAPVVQALDGQQVKLPGYIVPLHITADGRVSEFLLVPYYGACIHVPPPPSNQIVHVTAELGALIDDLYQPFWIEGPMRVQHTSSELAEAGYQMSAQKIYAYY